MVQNNLGQFLNVFWFVHVLLVLLVPVKLKADDKVLFEMAGGGGGGLEFIFIFLLSNFNQCSF